MSLELYGMLKVAFENGKMLRRKALYILVFRADARLTKVADGVLMLGDRKTRKAIIELLPGKSA